MSYNRPPPPNYGPPPPHYQAPPQNQHLQYQPIQPIQPNPQFMYQPLPAQAPLPPPRLPENLDEYEQPMEFYCRHCQAKRISVLKYEPGGWTWCCCCTLCLSTIILALLPFYLKDCQNITHVCPTCSQPVGKKTFEPCTCCQK